MSRVHNLLCCIAFCGFSSHGFAVYEPRIALAQQWLVTEQNSDGSWGDLSTEKYIATTVAVDALRSAGLRNETYYRGITWLENHSGNNNDYASRRAAALKSYGADGSSSWLEVLDAAQISGTSGRNGWGASAHYLESPLDTALTISALKQVGTSSGSATVTIQPALDYLKIKRIANAGWAVGTQTSSDPFSTALVIKGLTAWTTQDATLSSHINGGVAHLQSVVNSSSPIALQAMAAHAALLAGNTTAANTWLNNLNASQAANGSWASGNVYDTALALRAMAAADGLDSVSNQTIVSIPDANLRKAINAALGRGAFDALERGELAKLTTLNASNLAISDLTGLEWAVNLTTLDVRNNNITSTTPIDSLPLLTNLLLAGNPVMDLDGDQLSDSIEIAFGLDPSRADTDSDGLSDYAEVCFDGDCSTYTPFPAGRDTNGTKADSDNDKSSDVWELSNHRSPIINEPAVISLILGSD